MTEIAKVYCNTCKYETNHDVRACHERSYNEEFIKNGFYENYSYRFLTCRGCDTATLEEQYNCAGMRDNNGNNLYSYEYNPKRQNLGVRIPIRFLHVDEKLNTTYKEIITANQNGLAVVTAMGIRALLEGICVSVGIDDRKAYNLTNKIKLLKQESDIPAEIIDGLMKIKFLGDDAAHRLDAADKTGISLSIDLMEAMLIHMFESKTELRRKAELLKNAFA